MSSQAPTKNAQPDTMSEHHFTEAPASVNIKFVLNGFDTMLTLRNSNGRLLLQRLEAAIVELQRMGGYPRGHVPIAPTGQDTNATPPGSAPPQTPNGVRPIRRYTPDNIPICETHDIPMKASQFGGWYCTTKLPDGSFCSNKVVE